MQGYADRESSSLKRLLMFPTIVFIVVLAACGQGNQVSDDSNYAMQSDDSYESLVLGVNQGEGQPSSSSGDAVQSTSASNAPTPESSSATSENASNRTEFNGDASPAESMNSGGEATPDESQPVSNNTAPTSTNSPPPAIEPQTSQPPSGQVFYNNPKISSKFVPVFDATYNQNQAFLDSVAAAGHGQSIYDMQLAHNAFLNMFEATRNVQYLEQALTWMETQVSRATVIDRHGKRNWAALNGRGDPNFASEPTSFFLEEADGVSEMARLARIVLTDPSLAASYGSRAQVLADFVDEHVLEKWFITRVPEGGDYMGWLLNNANPVSNPGTISDKGLIYSRILMDMNIINPNAQYVSWYSDILSSFEQRFTSTTGPAGILIFDEGRHDTAHANRHIYTLVDAYEKGIVFSRAHVEGIAHLFVSRVWNQSDANPAFVNVMGGGNGTVFGRGPYQNGAIYFGWEKLGMVNPDAQRAVEAIFDSVVERRNNPSDAYNGTIYGVLGLAAGLSRNLALSQTLND